MTSYKAENNLLIIFEFKMFHLHVTMRNKMYFMIKSLVLFISISILIVSKSRCNVFDSYA